MSVRALIERLVAQGMDPIDAAEVVTEAALLGAANASGQTRSSRQERNARYYANKRLKASENKTIETVSDVSDAIKTPSVGPSRTQVVTPSLPSLRSEELIGGGVGDTRALVSIPSETDWPAGNAEVHAKLLIEVVASPWLDPNKSPDLVTTRGRVAVWRRDGASWEFDVLPVVTGLCANRRAKISSWKFFDQAVARSIAENRAALEIPEAGQVIQLRATGPPRSFDEKSSAAWDYAMKRIAEDG